MKAALSGTFAFLFTEIEDCVALWERYPTEMRQALRRHDAILRRAIEARGGRIFKALGTGFCAVFPTAPVAIAASVDGQRALRKAEWDGVGGLFVRMAVHVGTAEEREGDYFGPALNRVARLLQIGRGEQILVSSVVAELACSELEDGVELSYVGRYELAGFSGYEAIHRVTFSGGRTQFSPMLTATAQRHNLPEQLTSFVESGRVVQEVIESLGASRIVTLCGPGGVGKTRSALQAARQMTEVWRDGEWFVELESLSDFESIVQAVASILGVRDIPGRPDFETLLDYLKGRGVLLILDNCEHLVEPVARFVHSLLSRCPKVSALATSREALRILGETVVTVDPLEVPAFDPDRLPSIRELEASPAIALFLDRARSLEPNFRFDDANRVPIQQICARLDGLPLALELAAARTKQFTPSELARRLEDRFRLLTRGLRDSSAHHRTLHALVDWSWGLLTAKERILFRRLAVFAGGWTLEAAEAITAGNGFEVEEVLGLLTGLCEKSLVYSDTAGEVRFRFLETIRVFAAEKLVRADEGLALGNSHARFFAATCARAEHLLRSQKQGILVEEITRDIGNYRLALEAAATAPELREAALALCAGLARYWLLVGARFEGRSRIEPHLQHLDGNANVLVRAICGAAVLSLNLRDHASFVSEARLAIEVSSRCDDAWSVAFAAVVYSAALSVAPHLAREPADSSDLHDRARRLATEAGDVWLLTYVDYAQSRRAHARGDTGDEGASLERALRNARISGDRFLSATCALPLAHSLEIVDPARSVQLLAEAAATSRQRIPSIAACLESAVRLTVRAAEFDEAARLMGAAAVFRKAAGVPALRVDPNEYRQMLSEVLGEARFEQLFHAGRAMSADEAIAAIAALGARRVGAT